MKTMIFSALTLLFLTQSSYAASIRDLPNVSSIVVHHYDCRVAMFLSGQKGYGEKLFSIQPNISGHDSSDVKLDFMTDEVVASANSQMLQVSWLRSGKLIAGALTMVQNTLSHSQVLIVVDPSNDDSQVHLSCNAVMYSDLHPKGAQP